MGSWPSMGNFGFYILMTYGLTLIFMLLEPLVLKSQRQSVLRDVLRLMKINAKKK